MDEQKTQTQGQGTQTASQATIPLPSTSVASAGSTGTQPAVASSSLGLLDETRKAVADMDRVNRETREILRRREELLSAEMIQGRAYANLIEKKELTSEEYAKRLIAGTLNPLIDK